MMDGTPLIIVPDSAPVPAGQIPDTAAPPPGHGAPEGDAPGGLATLPGARPAPSPAEVALALAYLAELPGLEYAVCRKAEAKRLKRRESKASSPAPENAEAGEEGEAKGSAEAKE